MSNCRSQPGINCLGPRDASKNISLGRTQDTYHSRRRQGLLDSLARSPNALRTPPPPSPKALLLALLGSRRTWGQAGFNLIPYNPFKIPLKSGPKSRSKSLEIMCFQRQKAYPDRAESGQTLMICVRPNLPSADARRHPLPTRTLHVNPLTSC